MMGRLKDVEWENPNSIPTKRNMIATSVTLLYFTLLYFTLYIYIYIYIYIFILLPLLFCLLHTCYTMSQFQNNFLVPQQQQQQQQILQLSVKY